MPISEQTLSEYRAFTRGPVSPEVAARVAAMLDDPASELRQWLRDREAWLMGRKRRRSRGLPASLPDHHPMLVRVGDDFTVTADLFENFERYEAVALGVASDSVAAAVRVDLGDPESQLSRWLRYRGVTPVLPEAESVCVAVETGDAVP